MSLRMVVLVICVTENGSIGRWRVRIHLGAKNLSIHLDEMTSSRHIVSNTRYKTKLFIVISNYLWFLLSEEFLFPKGSIQDNNVLNSSTHVKGMIAENRCILEKTLCW